MRGRMTRERTDARFRGPAPPEAHATFPPRPSAFGEGANFRKALRLTTALQPRRPSAQIAPQEFAAVGCKGWLGCGPPPQCGWHH